MVWIGNQTRVLLAAGFGLCFGPIVFAANVAVIDEEDGAPVTVGLQWCELLQNNGFSCTRFPSTGPTGSLETFDVVVDLSPTWTDPGGTLAQRLQAGKGVITWGWAPGALGISTNPTVRAWIGANSSTNNCDHLLTLERDPIFGSLPPGTSIGNCGDGPCPSLLDTSGHPDTRILASYPCGGGIGVLRNTWEGGQSVYLQVYITPGDGPHDDEIILSTVRALGKAIPATSIGSLIIMTVAIVAAGIIVRSRRAKQSS
jgi:hypothetical protein